MANNTKFTFPWKQAIIALIGVMILALGSSILKVGGAGVDPYTAASFGVSKTIGWDLSAWQFLTNCILFIPALLWGRQTIGWGTIINMTLAGVFIQIFSEQLTPVANDVMDFMKQHVEHPDRWVVVFALIIGVTLFTYGSSLYMSAGIGQAPYDSFAVVLSGESSGDRYTTFRTVQDLFFLIVAWAFGGPIGVGTVCAVLLAGSCISWFNTNINDKLVAKIMGNKPAQAKTPTQPAKTS